MLGTNAEAKRYRRFGQPTGAQSAGDRGAIAAAEATVRYLPKYSPGHNPIEMPFSKFKAYLCKLAERTVPELRRAIRPFLQFLKDQGCANYLRHVNYASL
jgi:hypothetical protein